MLLSENQAVVDALKKILEGKDYEYLEYDEEYSRNQDFLKVKVTDPKPDRDISDAHSISKKLGQVTGRYFLNPASVGSGPRNPETDWAYFNIREFKKTAVNPDTGQHYIIMPPEPEKVRQAILELDFPPDGIRVVHATERLAEKLQISDEDKRAKNRSDLNFFRYDVVAPQFKRLLREGKLEQPNGPRTPYLLADMDPDPLNLEFRETSFQPEWPSVEKTALDPDTGEEYQIQLPATRVVKEALLDFDYPPSGIRIKDITEALTDQFELTEEQSEAKGNYGLVWKRHVNIAADSLVDSKRLLRTKRGGIINPEQYFKLFTFGTDSSDHPHDVFISHATEDKDEIVRPLAEALIARNVGVWYDEFELRIGDSLRGKIDEGLSNSRFGIVVLSHAFFQKKWTQYELDALVAREMADKSVILPIWHKITEDEIIDHSPRLIDKIARNTSDFTIGEIAQEIAEVIQNSRGPLSKKMTD